MSALNERVKLPSVYNGSRYVEVFVSWERQSLTFRETPLGALCVGWIPHDEKSPKRPSDFARRYARRQAEKRFAMQEYRESSETPSCNGNEDIVPIDDSAIGNALTLPEYRHPDIGCSDE